MADLQERTFIVAPETSSTEMRILTSQEADILQCIINGLQVSGLASAVRLPDATVKDHIKAILKRVQSETAR